MATWEDVGLENFEAAKMLLDNKKYRSATSRFYYSAFAALTGELVRRNARAAFANGRSTPGHNQLPDLVVTYFDHFGSERKKNLAQEIRTLYRDRIQADYGLLRIDRESTKETFRTANRIMRYLGVKT